MNNLIEEIELKKDVLKGRVASASEMQLLQERAGDFDGLTEVLNILQHYKIIEHFFKLTPHQDASGQGIAMRWLSPAGQIEEAFSFYPGMIVVSNGYWPVGECLHGSGDPYFIKKQEGSWNLYRVMHDISQDNIAPEMIELILPLSELFRSL